MVKINMDTKTVEPASFDVLPAGWYPMVLVKAEFKEKDGGAPLARIAYEFEVVDGAYKGRKVFGGWNQKGRNFASATDGQKKAVQIADSQLASLIVAVKGEGAVCDDTDELIGNVIDGKVKVRPAKDDFDASNEVVEFKKRGEGGKSAPASNGAKGSGKSAGPSWAQQK